MRSVAIQAVLASPFYMLFYALKQAPTPVPNVHVQAPPPCHAEGSVSPAVSSSGYSFASLASTSNALALRPPQRLLAKASCDPSKTSKTLKKKTAGHPAAPPNPSPESKPRKDKATQKESEPPSDRIRFKAALTIPTVESWDGQEASLNVRKQIIANELPVVYREKDEWDLALDAGRVKKVKTKKTGALQKDNMFQNLQKQKSEKAKQLTGTVHEDVQPSAVMNSKKRKTRNKSATDGRADADFDDY